jgi:hypothetical protein
VSGADFQFYRSYKHLAPPEPEQLHGDPKHSQRPLTILFFPYLNQFLRVSIQ